MEKINTYSNQKKPFLFIIDFDKARSIVVPLDEIKEEEILYNFKGFSNYSGKPLQANLAFSFEKYPILYKEYKTMFDKVQEHLRQGNSYLVNLTQPTRIKTSLTLRDIFIHSNAPYKLLVQHKFVLFSPEPFVEIHNGIISSFPMKGTIDAMVPDAEKIIMEDKKELAEHSTIVDLIRNDLSIVATEVDVKRFRYIDKIITYNSELLQVSSEISGKVRDELKNTLGTLLSLLLPAGSISGAPKRKTVEIIKEIEGYERGYYTGIFGYFDGQKLTSSVMIRFIEKINNDLWFKSGGGITIYSSAEVEYQELIDKVYVPINRIH